MLIKCAFCDNFSEYIEHNVRNDSYYFKPEGWTSQCDDIGGIENICPKCNKEFEDNINERKKLFERLKDESII